MFWDSARLQAGELQDDRFQTVMSGNIPDPQLLTTGRIVLLNSLCFGFSCHGPFSHVS